MPRSWDWIGVELAIVLVCVSLVGASSIVLRAEMFAPAHFMADRFYGFDAPVVIRPPA